MPSLIGAKIKKPVARITTNLTTGSVKDPNWYAVLNGKRSGTVDAKIVSVSL
jgi:hypothetical protein